MYSKRIIYLNRFYNSGVDQAKIFKYVKMILLSGNKS